MEEISPERWSCWSLAVSDSSDFIVSHGADISRNVRQDGVKFMHLVLLCFSMAETSPERWSCSNVKQRAKRRWENLATLIFPKMLSSKFWNDDNSVGLVLCRHWRIAFFFTFNKLMYCVCICVYMCPGRMLQAVFQRLWSDLYNIWNMHLPCSRLYFCKGFKVLEKFFIWNFMFVSSYGCRLHCCCACVLVIWCPAVCFHFVSRTFHEGLNTVVRCFGLPAYQETMNPPLPHHVSCHAHTHTHTLTDTDKCTHTQMDASTLQDSFSFVFMWQCLGKEGSIQLQTFTSLKVTIKNITFSLS